MWARTRTRRRRWEDGHSGPTPGAKLTLTTGTRVRVRAADRDSDEGAVSPRAGARSLARAARGGSCSLSSPFANRNRTLSRPLIGAAGHAAREACLACRSERVRIFELADILISLGRTDHQTASPPLLQASNLIPHRLIISTRALEVSSRPTSFRAQPLQTVFVPRAPAIFDSLQSSVPSKSTCARLSGE